MAEGDFNHLLLDGDEGPEVYRVGKVMGTRTVFYRTAYHPNLKKIGYSYSGLDGLPRVQWMKEESWDNLEPFPGDPRDPHLASYPGEQRFSGSREEGWFLHTFQHFSGERVVTHYLDEQDDRRVAYFTKEEWDKLSPYEYVDGEDA